MRDAIKIDNDWYAGDFGRVTTPAVRGDGNSARSSRVNSAESDSSNVFNCS